MNETSTERKHRFMVQDLTKPADAISQTLNSQSINVMHAALGIAGEGGEVVDLIKKSVINGKPLDPVALMKELGDLEFYLTLLRDTLGLDRDVILQMNINKLRERYGDGYSDAASAARVDVSPEEMAELTEVWDAAAESD